VNDFYFIKTFIENSAGKFEKPKPQKSQKRINGPRFYYESAWVQSRTAPITYRAYYVTQCL